MTTKDVLAETEHAGPHDFPDRFQLSALRRIAVRGGALLLGSRLFTQLFAWSITILVARSLRPYDYGVIAAGSVISGFAEILAEAGVGRALVQKSTLCDRDTDEAFTISFLIALSLYAILYIVSAPAAVLLRSPEQVAYLRVTGLFLLLMPFRSVPVGILNRRLELGRLSALGVCSALTHGLVLLGCAWAGFGYWSFVASLAAAAVLEVGTLMKLTGWRPRLRWPQGGYNPLIAFGMSLSGARLCLFLYSNADYAVVARLLGPVELGYYSLAFLVVSIPLQKLVANISGLAYPVFCRMSHEPDRRRNWFFRLTVLIGSLGTPALFGVALVAPDAFPLILGQKWAPAVLPLQIMCAAGVFMMIGGTFDGLFNALGRPDILLRYYLACFLIFPPCFFLAGRLYGVAGIALVWSLVCPLMVSALIVLTRPITGFGLGDLLRGQLPIWAASLFMIIIVLGAQFGLNRPDLIVPRLALSIVAGIVAYGLAIRALAWDSVMGNMKLLWRECAG